MTYIQTCKRPKMTCKAPQMGSSWHYYRILVRHPLYCSVQHPGQMYLYGFIMPFGSYSFLICFIRPITVSLRL